MLVVGTWAMTDMLENEKLESTTFSVSSVILPVALTELYLKSKELWPSDSAKGFSYSCMFEDDLAKISEIQPDLAITMTKHSMDSQSIDRDSLIVKRVIVASRDLVGDATISKPADLEKLPYATLDRSTCKHFFVTTPYGETMVVESKKVVGSNNLFAAHEAVKHGIAYAVLPKFMVLEDIRNGALISLIPKWPPQPYIIRTAISPYCKHPKRISFLENSLLERLKHIPGIEMLR